MKTEKTEAGAVKKRQGNKEADNKTMVDVETAATAAVKKPPAKKKKAAVKSQHTADKADKALKQDQRDETAQKRKKMRSTMVGGKRPAPKKTVAKPDGQRKRYARQILETLEELAFGEGAGSTAQMKALELLGKYCALFAVPEKEASDGVVLLSETLAEYGE